MSVNKSCLQKLKEIYGIKANGYGKQLLSLDLVW